MLHWPQLTESWAGVYLQIMVAILIFGIGLPALAIQAAVSEDVRRVAMRQSKWRKFDKHIFKFVVLLAIFTALFVWPLHPQDGDSMIIRCQRSSCLAIEQNQDPLTKGIESYSDWVSAAGVVCAIGFILVFWRGQRIYRRTKLLEHLKKKCDKIVDREGRIEEKVLEDIGYLGENGAPGMDKKDVLDLLGGLAKKVQDGENYSGAGLEPILNAIDKTLLKGDGDNIEHSAELLAGVAGRLREKELATSPDMRASLELLGRVGEMAFDLDSLFVTHSVLNIIVQAGRRKTGIERQLPRIISKLGAMALERKQFLSAVEALNRLEALAGEGVAGMGGYLGLVAHFWADGPAARERAKLGLARMNLGTSLSERIHDARKYHYMQAKLDTADKLDAMLADIKAQNSTSPRVVRQRCRALSSDRIFRRGRRMTLA